MSPRGHLSLILAAARRARVQVQAAREASPLMHSMASSRANAAATQALDDMFRLCEVADADMAMLDADDGV